MTIIRSLIPLLLLALVVEAGAVASSPGVGEPWMRQWQEDLEGWRRSREAALAPDSTPGQREEAALAALRLGMWSDVLGFGTAGPWYGYARELVARPASSWPDDFSEARASLWSAAIAGRMPPVRAWLDAHAARGVGDTSEVLALRCLATGDWRLLDGVRRDSVWAQYAYARALGEAGVVNPDGRLLPWTAGYLVRRKMIILKDWADFVQFNGGNIGYWGVVDRAMTAVRLALAHLPDDSWKDEVLAAVEKEGSSGVLRNQQVYHWLHCFEDRALYNNLLHFLHTAAHRVLVERLAEVKAGGDPVAADMARTASELLAMALVANSSRTMGSPYHLEFGNNPKGETRMWLFEHRLDTPYMALWAALSEVERWDCLPRFAELVRDDEADPLVAARFTLALQSRQFAAVVDAILEQAVERWCANLAGDEPVVHGVLELDRALEHHRRDDLRRRLQATVADYDDRHLMIVRESAENISDFDYTGLRRHGGALAAADAEAYVDRLADFDNELPDVFDHFMERAGVLEELGRLDEAGAIYRRLFEIGQSREMGWSKGMMAAWKRLYAVEQQRGQEQALLAQVHKDLDRNVWFPQYCSDQVLDVLDQNGSHEEAWSIHQHMVEQQQRQGHPIFHQRALVSVPYFLMRRGDYEQEELFAALDAGFFARMNESWWHAASIGQLIVEIGPRGWLDALTRHMEQGGLEAMPTRWLTLAFINLERRRFDDAWRVLMRSYREEAHGDHSKAYWWIQLAVLCRLQGRSLGELPETAEAALARHSPEDLQKVIRFIKDADQTAAEAVAAQPDLDHHDVAIYGLLAIAEDDWDTARACFQSSRDQSDRPWFRLNAIAWRWLEDMEADEEAFKESIRSARLPAFSPQPEPASTDEDERAPMADDF